MRNEWNSAGPLDDNRSWGSVLLVLHTLLGSRILFTAGESRGWYCTTCCGMLGRTAGVKMSASRGSQSTERSSSRNHVGWLRIACGGEQASCVRVIRCDCRDQITRGGGSPNFRFCGLRSLLQRGSSAYDPPACLAMHKGLNPKDESEPWSCLTNREDSFASPHCGGERTRHTRHIYGCQRN
jgi:hypothetical protein